MLAFVHLMLLQPSYLSIALEPFSTWKTCIKWKQSKTGNKGKKPYPTSVYANMFVVCMREREQLTYKQERKKSNQGKHNYFTDSFYFRQSFP